MNEAETGIEQTGRLYGMLATVINGMAVQAGWKTGVYYQAASAIKMEQIAEPYIRRRAMRHRKRKGCDLWCRNRKPYFTTDTARLYRGYWDQGRRYIKRNRGRWYLFCRPGKRSWGDQIRTHIFCWLYFKTSGLWIWQLHPLHGKQPADHCFRYEQSREPVKCYVTGERVGTLVSWWGPAISYLH